MYAAIRVFLPSLERNCMKTRMNRHIVNVRSSTFSTQEWYNLASGERAGTIAITPKFRTEYTCDPFYKVDIRRLVEDEAAISTGDDENAALVNSEVVA